MVELAAAVVVVVVLLLVQQQQQVSYSKIVGAANKRTRVTAAVTPDVVAPTDDPRDDAPAPAPATHDKGRRRIV